LEIGVQKKFPRKSFRGGGKRLLAKSKACPTEEERGARAALRKRKSTKKKGCEEKQQSLRRERAIKEFRRNNLGWNFYRDLPPRGGGGFIENLRNIGGCARRGPLISGEKRPWIGGGGGRSSKTSSNVSFDREGTPLREGETTRRKSSRGGEGGERVRSGGISSLREKETVRVTSEKRAA